jgi:hypothetical protein
VSDGTDRYGFPTSVAVGVPPDSDGTVALDAETLSPYARFSLYNSPYPAHEGGCAVDCYPDRDDGLAPSPVAGEVVETRTVRAPSKPYAAAHDHLLLVDTGDLTVRVLHVDPSVAPGDTVAVGDPLGTTVRSGYFAPWVDDHLHVGFRPPSADAHRASGSLRLDLGVDVDPLDWDGRGTVSAVGETYARLDEPTAGGSAWAGVAATASAVLDGGCPHYAGGALPSAEGAVALAGERVGVADGRDVTWDDVTVRANGRAVVGLSLFVARGGFGAKLVAPDHDFAVGESVRVTVD